jgi:hypothetical protein
MVSLSDSQLEILMTALRPLRSEQERRLFLQLLESQLRLRDIDVQSACDRALANIMTEAQ